MIKRPHWLITLAVAGTAFAGPAEGPGAKLPKRAVCPVDGKSIDRTPETLFVRVNGEPRYLCRPACRTKLAAWPEKYLREMAVQCTVQPRFKGWIQLSRRVEVNNDLCYLCCEPCARWLRDKPRLYLKEARDPVSGHAFKLADTSPKESYRGQIYVFESRDSQAQFDKEPEKYAVIHRR